MVIRFLRSAIVAVAGLALAIEPLGVPRAIGAPLTRAEYEACQAADEQGFKSAIESITLKSLQEGFATVDFKASIGEEWRRLGMAEIIDKRVDAAIAEVRDETSWGALLQSLAYQDKAKELATTVAERVYRSEAMKVAIESLAVAIGKEVGRTIELATVTAAEPSVQCMQAFLGPRFGSVIAGVVARDAGKEFSIDPVKAGAKISSGTVLFEGSEGLAGAVILLVRRQLSNMASRIGQRMVGAVLGRLVSVVAGGVGVVLIAKDLWDFRNGVLPIIADEMKSAETKQRVQEELAKTIAEQLNDQMREIATKTAERVAEIWQDFRRAHAKVLELAQKNESFKGFIETTKVEQLPRLDEVVGLVIAREGDEGIPKRLANGTLRTAVRGLDDTGMQIARETQSIDAALGWASLAGDRLGTVVANEMYQRASPDDFTKASLNRVLSLQDRLAAVRLSGVSRETRDVLFELDDADLKNISRALTESELTSLSRYLTGLHKAAGQRVLRAVAQTPARMKDLSSSRVRNALINSRDQDAAVGMMLRASSGLDPTVMTDDIDLVLDGRVSPVLLWEKHPIVIMGTGVLTVLLILFLRSLIFVRRRRVRV